MSRYKNAASEETWLQLPSFLYEENPILSVVNWNRESTRHHLIREHFKCSLSNLNTRTSPRFCFKVEMSLGGLQLHLLNCNNIYFITPYLKSSIFASYTARGVLSLHGYMQRTEGFEIDPPFIIPKCLLLRLKLVCPSAHFAFLCAIYKSSFL